MTTSSKSCSGWCSSFGRFPFPSPSLLRNMAIKGDASDIDAKVAFMRIKKPPHPAGGTDCRQKAILPRRGKIALSANKRIAEFLNFATQAKFAYVNKLTPPHPAGGQSAMICYPARGERACLRLMGKITLPPPLWECAAPCGRPPSAADSRSGTASRFS